MNYLQAQTISVCDNGGFEQDFLYYSGETATFRYGSNDCNPLKSDSVTPVVFTSAGLPTSKRLEIVTSGIDSLVGINRTKFGSKALRINSRFGHIDDCAGNWGVDRIIKEFKVTEETRNFTVWYALVLENPIGHVDQQPFFHIKCDLAPDDELCFDASILMCEQEPMDTICNYYSLDVLNWTCHRIRIPKSEVGNTATLEITVSDCGAGGHFGYAYIDGICEDCDSSALGSSSLDSIRYTCVPDTATICGNYSLPNVCNQNWDIKDVTIPGYTISDLVIDKSNQTFCFDFPESNLGIDTCIEIYAQVIFSDATNDLPPVTSNSIVVCKSQFDTIDYSVTVGACDDNGTPTNLSDDNYNVTYDLTNTNNQPWTIERKLDNPYPDENDTHTIASGTGDASGTLGSFLIQEGSWTLIITINDDCVYEIAITPPDYCGDCTEFNDMTISNISRDCSNGAPGTWAFDLYVPGPVGGTYDVIGTGGGNNKSFNTTISISGLSILPSCIEYTLVDLNPQSQCQSKFTICPPKPCKTPSCDLEVYVKSAPCLKDNNTGVVTFTVELEVSGGTNLCYTVNGGTPTSLPSNQIIGPYTADIEVVISSCSASTCSVSNCTDFWKVMYVPKPECHQTQGLILATEEEESSIPELKIFSNPVTSGEFLIQSSLPKTQFIIIDAYGHTVMKDVFEGNEKRFSFTYPPGLYFFRYKTSNNRYNIIKMIKL